MVFILRVINQNVDFIIAPIADKSRALIVLMTIYEFLLRYSVISNKAASKYGF
jgi:hypothetical protein